MVSLHDGDANGLSLAIRLFGQVRSVAAEACLKRCLQLSRCRLDGTLVVPGYTRRHRAALFNEKLTKLQVNLKKTLHLIQIGAGSFE